MWTSDKSSSKRKQQVSPQKWYEVGPWYREISFSSQAGVYMTRLGLP